MRDLDRGFRIDGIPVDWGTTLAAAADLFGVRPEGCRRIGYSTLSVPCRSAFGFATICARMTGYGLSRPVTTLACELAPPAGGPPEPEVWSGTLSRLLGKPVRETVEDVSDRPNPWDAVRYHASWEGTDCSVSLSVYGALRAVPEGKSAGTLWLGWSIEKAAGPFLPLWRAACAALAVATKGARLLGTFTLGYDQHPKFADGAIVAGKGGGRREAWLALAAPDVLETPEALTRRLSRRQFALWSNPKMSVHCLSTRRDSVIWDDGASPAIEWLQVRPAKGAGQSALGLGNWSVSDVAGSAALRDAVAALETLPGVRVRRVDGGYDC
jgi:hypothetical protein